MKISARNVFKVKITHLSIGVVNAEVELTTAGGDKLVAIVTETSVKSLGLAIGEEIIAYVKAPMGHRNDGCCRCSLFSS